MKVKGKVAILRARLTISEANYAKLKMLFQKLSIYESHTKNHHLLEHYYSNQENSNKKKADAHRADTVRSAENTVKV